MRYIKQRHVHSCGIACVAMIANKAYETVLQDYIDYDEPIYWVWKEENQRWCLDFGTSMSDLSYMLNHYGIKTNKRLRKYKNQDELPDTCIMNAYVRKATIGGKTYYTGHWVVCVKEGRKYRILDPWHGEKTLQDIHYDIDTYVRVHV